MKLKTHIIHIQESMGSFWFPYMPPIPPFIKEPKTTIERIGPKDPQDPPMEGARKNLYDAGVYRSSKWRQFWGSNDP